MRNPQAVQIQRAMIFACVLLAVYFWGMHAVIEYFYGTAGESLLQNMLPLHAPTELLHRIILSAVIILGGLVAAPMLGRISAQRNSAASSADDLNATLNSIGDAVIATDRDGRVTRMNPVAARLTGMDAGSAAGKKLTEVFRIINAVTGEPADDPVSRVLATGEIVGLANHTALLSHDGKEYQIADSGAPIRDAGGAVVGVVLVFRDVTEDYAIRERVAKSEEDLRITLDSIGDAVIATDREGRVTRMNPVAARLTGMVPGAAMGKKLTEVFRIINAVTREAADDPVSRVLATGEIVGLANHTALLSHDGKEYQIADSGAPIRDTEGRIVGVVLVFRDVTDEYAMREKLSVSEERMSSLFVNMNEGVALHDVILNDAGKPIEYRIVDINPRYEKIIGVKREDVCGKLSSEAYGTPEPPYLIEFTSVGLTGIPYRFETYFPPMDKHFSISVAPWGKNGFATIFSDISERKKAEAALKDSEFRHRTLFENMMICAAVYEAVDDGNDFVIIDFNKKAEQIEAVQRSAVIGRRVRDVFPGVDSFGIMDVFRRVWKTGVPEEFPVGMYTDERISGWRENFIYKLPSGEVVALYEDITARKQAEDALFRKNEELDRFFNTNLDLLCIADMDGYFRRLNPEWENTLGYTLAELQGMKFLDLVHPDDREQTLAAVARLSEQQAVIDFVNRYRCKDGSYRYIEWRSYPAGNFIHAVARDITARITFEMMLKERETRLASILRAAPVGIGVTVQRTLKQANERLAEMTGYSVEELIDMPARKLYPDDAEYQRVGDVKYAQIRETGTGTVETKWQRKDGTCIDVLLSSTPMDKNDHSRGVTFTALDITEAKRVENELKESEARNRAFLKAIPDLIFVIDKDGTFLDYNAGRQDELYARPEVFLGKKVCEVLPADVAAGLLTTAAHVEKTGIMGLFEYELAMPTGDSRSFEARLTPYGPGRIAALVRDVTVQKNEEAERKRREERLMQTEKLLSLGELTAGLAHEINQPLTALSLGLSNAMLLASPERMDAAKVREKLARLTENVKRISSLMEHVRTFSREQKSTDAGVCNVAEAVDGALSLVRVQYENDLVSFSVLHDEPLAVLGNRYRFEQVLLNLLTNARDSLAEKARGVKFKKEIIIRVYADGAKAVISVRDNGMGISPVGMRRLFEPFFTTKPVGKGTGLGLSVSYGIIRDMNGTIEAQSEEGQFAEFIITLPLVKG